MWWLCKTCVWCWWIASLIATPYPVEDEEANDCTNHKSDADNDSSNSSGFETIVTLVLAYLTKCWIWCLCWTLCDKYCAGFTCNWYNRCDDWWWWCDLQPVSLLLCRDVWAKTEHAQWKAKGKSWIEVCPYRINRHRRTSFTHFRKTRSWARYQNRPLWRYRTC